MIKKVNIHGLQTIYIQEEESKKKGLILGEIQAGSFILINTNELCVVLNPEDEDGDCCYFNYYSNEEANSPANNRAVIPSSVNIKITGEQN